MKKMAVAVLVFLLLALTFQAFPKFPKVPATTEDLWATPGLPEDVPQEPMPENYTTEDYLNTTNPYNKVNPLGEETDEEGSHPLYVLVFGDEEERDVLRWWENPPMPYSWVFWAKMQLERGDDSLVANFGIDIRILGFEEWDSDDSLDNMYDLWDELEEDTEQYLGQWYNGEWWSNYVDAIIGITSQVDPYPVAGLSPGPELLDQGRIFTLLNWWVYWADDNLVQHEVSHLHYAPDHHATCCVMASHTHFQTWIWEGLLWWVFNDVHCLYTAYSWCTNCHQVIQQNSARYGAVCAMKTLTDGDFYVPTVATDLLKIEKLFDDSGIEGDQTGETSPYSSIANYPDKRVDMADQYFIAIHYGSQEADSNWDYMADVNADRWTDMMDLYIVANNFGNNGTYIDNFTGVQVFFDDDPGVSPDNGWVTIPEGAENFIVKQNGNRIGAMVIFW